jgi:endonuclease-3
MRPREKIAEIVRRLEAQYGPRPWKRRGEPLEGLIRTVLSQHTSDANSDAAYRQLRRAFPTWEACLAAPPARVEQAIRTGGLAKGKTRTIQGILRTLRAQRGELTLKFLTRWSTPKVREYLRALPGVGPKTAACVLLFNLGRPALPVDTHVYRLAGRLGLIPPGVSAERAHELLEAACPPRLVYPFHVLLIQHGRRVCRARRSECDECPLVDLCPSARLD